MNKLNSKHKELILNLIETIQLNTNIRGASFSAICEILSDYNESQVLRLLSEMKDTGHITSTGILKNRKYNLIKFAEASEVVHDYEMNNFIYPLAAANGVNMYKSMKNYW